MTPGWPSTAAFEPPHAGLAADERFSFTSLAEAIPDPVVMWSSVLDTDGTITDFRYEYVNAAAERVIGIARAQLVGSLLLEVLPAHRELGLFDRYAEVARTGVAATIEIPWFEDGNVAGAFEASVAPMGGGIVSIARDVTGRVLTERRLEESEAWARSLLEHSNDAVIHSRDGVVQWVSPSIEAVLGRTPESLVGLRTEDLCHPDDVGELHAMRRRPPGDASGRLRVRLLAGDGSWRWVDSSVRPWQDEPGPERRSFVSVIRDVHPEVEAQTATVDAERRLSTILDATHDGIVIIGPDGSNLFANGAVRRLSGHDPDHVRGTSAFDRIHPDDADALRTAVLALAPGAQTVHRARVLGSEGQVLHAEISVSNLLDDPAIGGYLATLHDRTAELAAAAALAESDARHRSLMEVVPDAVVVVEDYVIEFANEAAARLCGVPAEADLIGVPMASFMSPEVAAVAAEYGSRFVETGTTDGPFVAWMRRRDGSPVLVEATPATVPGHPRAVLLLMRDIGERERLLAELAASEARASFLADNATDVLLRVDAAHCVVFASRAASALLELAPEDIDGVQLHDLFLVQDRAAVDAAVESALEIGVAEPCEVRAAMAAHGGVAWVELSVRSVLAPAEDGDLAVEYHVTLSDVRERREARLALAASELRLRTLVESAPVGIFECDLDGRATYVNSRYCEIAGLDPDVRIGLTVGPTVHPDDVEAVTTAWAEAIRAQRSFRAEFRYLVDRDGGPAVVWVDVESVPVVDADGWVRSFIGTVTDITERRELEQASFEAAELFSAAFDHAPTGMVLTSVSDEDVRIIRANGVYLDMVGCTAEDAPNFDVYSLVHPDDVVIARMAREAIVAGDAASSQIEMRHRRQGSADYRWFSLTRSVVRDGEGSPRFVVAQLADVHDRRAAEELAHRLALTDPLTGLSNRRHFLDRLAHAHARLERAELPLAVVFVDLDHFKSINDDLGHEAGDALLNDVAERIAGSVRPGDTVARLGGDEFAVIVEDVPVSEVRGIAERLCRRIDLTRQVPDGRRHRVTASVGVALAEPPGRADATDVLRRADEAMYCAKQLGRARWVVLDEPVAGRSRVPSSPGDHRG